MLLQTGGWKKVFKYVKCDRKCEKRVSEYVHVQEVGQLAEVWEVLHMNLTRSLARAREERRAQAQLEVSGGNVF